jgi:hypothetical protein
MDFDFSDEQKQLRDEPGNFAEKCPPAAVRPLPFDKIPTKGR